MTAHWSPHALPPHALWAIVAIALVPLVWPRPADALGSAGIAPVTQTGDNPADAPADAPVGDDDVRAVAACLDLLALALASGVPLVSAIEAVAVDSGSVVRRHLRQVAAAMRWGVDEVRAWDGLPDIWKPAAAALALATTAGVPPGVLLRRAAADIRREERQRLDEAIGRVSVLIVVPLGLCFLPAFALLTVLPVVMTIARGVLAGTS